MRLIDGPYEIGDRTVLILEQAGEQTLGQYLRREGRLTIGDLENLGEHLFQAVELPGGRGHLAPRHQAGQPGASAR